MKRIEYVMRNLASEEENMFDIMKDKCPSIISGLESVDIGEVGCEEVSPCDTDCLKCWLREM